MPAVPPLTAENLTPERILAWALDVWEDRLAFTTGLGPGGICVLHLARSLRPRIRCAFLDTGFHFPETLEYARDIAARLDIELVAVEPEPFGPTWRTDRLACCDHRKVEPLARALRGYDAWINARRADQGGLRAEMPLVERDEQGFVKINPLARASKDWVRAYMARHALPRHPLLDQGYGSIGCEPCTRKLRPGESERDGRLFAGGKSECGIHTRLVVRRDP